MKFSSRFMRFIGGRDIFIGLFLLILIGITILIYNKISFVFHPFIVIFSTIAPLVILAFIAYYIMNPIVNLLERVCIKRVWGILVIIIEINFLFTVLFFLLVPAFDA